jgi:adenylate cyclase
MPKETSKPGNSLARRAWDSFSGGIIGALLAAGIGVLLLYLKFGIGLIHLSYDLPYSIRPAIRPQEAVIVYMDDDSFKILNQPYNAPWDRSLHAQLLNRLTAAGAKAVVFDIVFSDATKPEDDKEFAEAIRKNGKVVIAADVVPAGYGTGGVLAKQIIPPYDPFIDAGATIGTDETAPDDDLVIRHQVLLTHDDILPTMSWAAAQIIGAPVTTNADNEFVLRWMNYYGPATTIPNVSYYRVFSTNAVDAVPPDFFSNKVVFIGPHLLTKYAGERKDEYPTPYSRWAKQYPFTPGTEIQATAFLNLARGDWLNSLSPNAELAVFIVCGALFGFGLARVRPLPAVGISFLLAILVCISAYLSFVHLRIWFPWLLLEVEIFVALAWSVVYNSIRLYVQNKLFEASLEMYLSPKLVKKFAANRDLLKPGAKKETLTILFSDIASFTSISEGMDSDELAKHMNSYFQTAVSGCIHHTDGTIVKYIGDAIFAFWNAPDPQDDHQLRACEAGLKFRDQPPQFMNGQQLITRIGLHTGVANVGNFGSTARVDYTALGENINLASRMEGLNKYLGTEVLITQETFDGIQGRLVARFLGLFRLKGFERSVGVYELVGTPDKAESFRALHEVFAAALKLFSEKKLAEAEAAFQKVLAINPKDGPSKFYLKHLAELKEHPLPENWNGEVELKEK